MISILSINFCSISSVPFKRGAPDDYATHTWSMYVCLLDFQIEEEEMLWFEIFCQVLQC